MLYFLFIVGEMEIQGFNSGGIWVDADTCVKFIEEERL